MTPEQVSRELRLVAEQRRGEATPTFGIRISDMAGSAADAIDQLLAIIGSGSASRCDNYACGSEEKGLCQADPLNCSHQLILNETGCIHCNGGRALIIGDTDDRGIAIQHPNKLIAFGYSDPHGCWGTNVSCLIEYCPRCGNKLGGAS